MMSFPAAKRRNETRVGVEQSGTRPWSRHRTLSVLHWTPTHVHVYDQDRLLTMKIKRGRLVNYIPENASILNGQLDVS